jgi:hypothetical protein
MAKEFNKRKALLSQCRDYFRSCLNGYSKERFQPFPEIQAHRLMGHNKMPSQTSPDKQYLRRLSLEFSVNEASKGGGAGSLDDDCGACRLLHPTRYIGSFFH